MIRPETFFFFWMPVIALLFTVLPWVIGFTFVRVDADRHGQPGWLWAVLTLPLGWLAILGYLIVRAFVTQGPALRR